jgi:hypothetical protein
VLFDPAAVYETFFYRTIQRRRECKPWLRTAETRAAGHQGHWTLTCNSAAPNLGHHLGRVILQMTGGSAMKEDKDLELDCSKNCKFVVQACEAEGRSREECENRYNQCVSNCAFA